MTKTKFDPPSEPPDGDPVCRICEAPLEWTLVGWECTHYHDTEEEDAIYDGFGSSVSVVCPMCGDRTMQVVRPGKFQCSECG